MCRGTGLHANKARRQSFEERYHLAAAKLLSDDDLLGRVNAVNLKHVLAISKPIVATCMSRAP
jgi:hypothetical protein